MPMSEIASEMPEALLKLKYRHFINLRLNLYDCRILNPRFHVNNTKYKW